MRARRTVTEVARNFSEVVTRVSMRGERVDLVRGGRVVAAIIPAPEGVRRARTAAARARREAWVEAVLARIPVLDVDLAAARAHARLWADLAARGTLIGAHDLWLAAQAIAGGHAVVTLNNREFARVPG